MDIAEFKTRPPVWQDVLDLFALFGPEPFEAVSWMAAKRGREVFGRALVVTDKAQVSAEWWNEARLGALLDAGGHAGDGVPRSLTHPVIVLRHKGIDMLLDGKRRCALWRQVSGLYPVVVVTI
jgi:hypothetical protein